MKTLREAAEMALEALIAATPVKAKDPQMQADAINALRTALAEPEPEPVAYGYRDARGNIRLLNHYETKMDRIPLYTYQPQRKPLTDESIGEVAIQDTQYHGYAMAIKPHIQVALEEGTKLYTSPPQRKPLTDEEITVLVLEWWCPTMVTAKDRKFVRAIERAHGIGNEK